MFGPPQSVGKPGDMISLCVGGRLFVTRRATLYRLPDSRLYLIATQGASCQSSTGCSSFATPDMNTPSPMSNIFSSSSTGLLSPNPAERAVIGGASILPGNMSAMLTGNMNLTSASSLVRNRGSTAQSVQTPLLTTNICGLNSPANLSLSVNSQTPNPTPNVCGPLTPTPPVVYFYDRDPEIFRFVLDYYRTGELHLPSSICGPFVRKELIFWGIDESLIGPCCMPAYMRYDEEKRTKNTLFRDCFEDIDSMQNLVKYSRGWKKWRYRMWLFMDHPSSSLPAKIWASCLLVLMIASVMCYCLSTHAEFRMTSAVYESRRLMSNKAPAPRTSLHSALSAVNRRLHPDLMMSIHEVNGTSENDSESVQLGDICDPTVNFTNPKMKKDCFSEPTRGLVLADMALNCLFTAEFMLKVLLAPDKQKFLSSIVSILDIIILSSYWVYMALFHIYYYHPKTLLSTDSELHDQLLGYLWLMNILSMTQAMRILRIFKISKISRLLRVLILTVKKSIPELVLLGFLLMNGMFLFSSLMYMAEYRVSDTFLDIPQSFWWSIITLTAVGYGDMHPKGGAGYFVGSVAAICGCIVTGLAIPIIGNNFNTYYKYMKNQLMEDKYLKTLRKDMEVTGNPGTKSGIGAAADKSGLPLPGRKLRQLNNRNNFRGRANDRSLRQKLDGMLYLNRLSLKKFFTSKAARTRAQKVTANNLKDLESFHGMAESQHVPLIRISRKSISESVITREKCNQENDSKQFTATAYKDSVDSERRPSMLQPQTTDNFLSALSNTRLPNLHTPEICVEGEDEEAPVHFHPTEDPPACLQMEIKRRDVSPCPNGDVPPNFTNPSRLTSPRNSYQEIDFIPPSGPEAESEYAKRVYIFNKRYAVNVSTVLDTTENTQREEQNTYDSYGSKRKTYV